MTIGNARGFNAPRIADDDFGAVVRALITRRATMGWESAQL